MIATRPPLATSLASWAWVAAVVVAVTLIGQLRSQASEVGGARPLLAPEQNAEIVRMELPATERATEDDESELDALQVVPAIYAWDPDVRFVFFRHVSKWM